ncbi:MAG: hypothetical protein OEZ39_10930 [Gammaproteobacteria bacterium]|nr:hypothetical protein [Gammaproteobacteria bacterium]MDH5652358.1 hypothetical protein [Gammaproteobacteria bacterium]
MPVGKSFPSRIVADKLGEQFKTSRFNTYLNSGRAHAVQQDGIYGLLNEFNAYYHGVVAYNSIRKKKIWKNYINNDTCEPFYELKLWILEHILISKEKYPDIYQDLIGNKTYFHAFTNIHDRFARLCTYRMNLKSAAGKDKMLKDYKPYIDRLNSEPVKSVMKQTYLWAK